MNFIFQDEDIVAYFYHDENNQKRGKLGKHDDIREQVKGENYRSSLSWWMRMRPGNERIGFD